MTVDERLVVFIGEAGRHALSTPRLIAPDTFFGVYTQIDRGNFKNYVMVPQNGHEFRDLCLGEALSLDLAILDGKRTPYLAVLTLVKGRTPCKRTSG